MALKPSVILNPGHRIQCLSFCFGEQIVQCWESQIGWWLERRLTVKDWLSEHLVLDWLSTKRWIEIISQILLCFIVFARSGNDLWVTTFLLWSWLSLVFSLLHFVLWNYCITFISKATSKTKHNHKQIKSFHKRCYSVPL